MSSFLLRAFTSVQLLTVRDRLVLKKVRTKSGVLLYVLDDHARLVSARYCVKSPDGKGFLISDAHWSGSGWEVLEYHDLAPSMKVAEEWVMRGGISNFLKNRFEYGDFNSTPLRLTYA